MDTNRAVSVKFSKRNTSCCKLDRRSGYPIFDASPVTVKIY